MPPIKLTDDEMNAVYAACRPLPVADRDAFLQALADALRQRGEIGPGVVYRVIRDVQRRFFRPPEFEEAHRSSKYGR
jgi:hypothetical protein